MGFGISVKAILPGKPFATKKWLDEIARTQRQTSIPRLKKLFNQTIFGWSKKPDFGWVQTRTADEISIRMYPTGPNAETWKLVSAGSPPHPIPARTGGLLRFRPGYRAATRPGQLMSRRAYRSGKYVSSRGIIDPPHPGFAARNFTQLIAEEYQNPFFNDMASAFGIVARS